MARKVPLSQSRQTGRALLQAALHSASEKEIERWRLQLQHRQFTERGDRAAGRRHVSTLPERPEDVQALCARLEIHGWDDDAARKVGRPLSSRRHGGGL